MLYKKAANLISVRLTLSLCDNVFLVLSVALQFTLEFTFSICLTVCECLTKSDLQHLMIALHAVQSILFSTG